MEVGILYDLIILKVPNGYNSHPIDFKPELFGPMFTIFLQHVFLIFIYLNLGKRNCLAKPS